MSYTNLTVTNLLTLGNQLKIEVPNWDDIIIYGVQGMQTGDDPVLYLSNASLWADNDVLVFGFISSVTDPSKSTGGGAIVIGHGWTDTTDYPAIIVTDYPGTTTYDTLWLKHSAASTPSDLSELDWGNLELQDLTAHGAIKSANNGAGYRSYFGGGGGGAQGGTYIDEWGNMKFDGGSYPNSWNIFNMYGHPVFNVPAGGGATFFDGNGNAKAGISNGGNISALGTITVGTIPYKSVSGPLYASSQAGSVGTICYNGSSKRFKTNIEDLSDCSWVYNLKPVTFNSKFDTDGNRQIGLIAEDVNEFCPQLVFSDVDGAIAGVHYEWLGIPLLVEVKKLHNRIEALENQLNHKQTAA